MTLASRRLGCALWCRLVLVIGAGFLLGGRGAALVGLVGAALFFSRAGFAFGGSFRLLLFAALGHGAVLRGIGDCCCGYEVDNCDMVVASLLCTVAASAWVAWRARLGFRRIMAICPFPHRRSIF